MSSTRPLVSVVTPVHNGEPYIAECVESVLAQTYDHLEYIVVDNCSTDATPDIVRRYAERDPRLRLVQPAEFVGPDPNANRALREISPDSSYTKVVHADDLIFPECLERMVGLAAAHSSVGVVAAYRLEGCRVTLDGLPLELTVVPGREICRSQLLGRPWGYLFGSPSSVLYRSDLVRSRPEFYALDNPFQSDQEACLLLLQESDFGFVHQVLTYTRRHEGADSTYYERVGAEEPGQLRLLVKYGPIFLRQDELERRLAARALAYVAMLARHPARLRRREFREFHARTFAELHGAIAAGDIGAGVLHAFRRRVAR